MSDAVSSLVGNAGNAEKLSMAIATTLIRKATDSVEGQIGQIVQSITAGSPPHLGGGIDVRG